MKKQVDYQRVQLVVFALLVAYGIANMFGVNIPTANMPAVNRVIDLLAVVLSVDQLRNRIGLADSQPSLPPPPPLDNLEAIQAAAHQVSVAMAALKAKQAEEGQTL